MKKMIAGFENLPKDQQDKCKMIIHGAAAATGGVGTGMAQIPLSDSAVITPIQIGMIVSLGKVLNLKITETAAQSIIGSATAAIAGRGVSQVLFGWFPFLGNALNTATAAGLTEIIGWLAVKHFISEGEKYSSLDKETYEQEEILDTQKETKDDKYKELNEQADAFLNGEKSRVDNANEFDDLVGKLGTYTLVLNDDDPLKVKYFKLVNLW